MAARLGHAVGERRVREDDDHPLADGDGRPLAVDEPAPGRRAPSSTGRDRATSTLAASLRRAAHDATTTRLRQRQVARCICVEVKVTRIGKASCRTGRPTRSSPRCRCRARAAQQRRPGSAARSSEFAATPPTTAIGSCPRCSRGLAHALDERPHDRPLVATPRGRPARRSSLVARGRGRRTAAPSSARRRRSRGPARARPGRRTPRDRPRAQPVDRGAARIAEAEQARALVERLAGRVVERRAEHVASPARSRTSSSSVCPPLASRQSERRLESGRAAR